MPAVGYCSPRMQCVQKFKKERGDEEDGWIKEAAVKHNTKQSRAQMHNIK